MSHEGVETNGVWAILLPLHCLGIDHERLVFRSQGRDFRLTDVHGKVVKGLLV